MSSYEDRLIYFCKKRWADIEYFRNKGYDIKTHQDCSVTVVGIEGLDVTGYSPVGYIDLDYISKETKKMLQEMFEKEIITLVDDSVPRHHNNKAKKLFKCSK